MPRRRLVRAVCDTSVLVPARTRRHLVRAAAEALFVPYWSPWIIGELYRVLTWHWLERQPIFDDANWDRCSRTSKTMMAILAPLFVVVDPKPPWPPMWPDAPDPDDHPIWAAVQASRARYVVSNNLHDFPPADSQGHHLWEGVEYITPPEFFRRIGYEPAEEDQNPS